MRLAAVSPRHALPPPTPRPPPARPLALPPPAAIRGDLATARSGGVAPSEEAVKRLWEGWTARAGALQRRVNESTLILPAFDVRKAQLALDALGCEVTDAKAAIAPRKRFAFSKRPTGAGSSDATGAGGGADTPAARPTAPAPAPAPASAPAPSKWAQDDHVISGRDGAVVVIPLGHFSGLRAAVAGGGEGDAAGAASPPPSVASAKDVRLLGLTRSVVVLLDVTRALRIDNLSRCLVIAGPTAGSVLLHNCTHCVLWLASRQIRIHTSTDCTFHLHVLSRPIIEHCDRVTFAPYALSFAGLPAAMAAAGLHQPGAGAPPGGRWWQVDDFGWHRLQRSPHWRVLPLPERPSAGAEALVAVGSSCLRRSGSATSGDGEGSAATALADLEAAVDAADLRVCDASGPGSPEWVAACGEPPADEAPGAADVDSVPTAADESAVASTSPPAVGVSTAPLASSPPVGTAALTAPSAHDPRAGASPAASLHGAAPVPPAAAVAPAAVPLHISADMLRAVAAGGGAAVAPAPRPVASGPAVAARAAAPVPTAASAAAAAAAGGDDDDDEL
jgi:tubulin-specific chaperone C